MKFTIASLVVLLPVIASIRIQCEYKAMYWYYIEIETYTCVTSLLNIVSPDTTVDRITGTHAGFNDNDDVQAISIVGSICEYMPKGFENFFSNIEGLKISASSLKVIRMSDLRPFPKLKNIDFAKNHLTSLDGNLFAYNPNLKIVSFQDNLLSSISSRLFDSVKGIEEVYFSDNICISMNATNSFYISDLVEKISQDCENAPTADLYAQALPSVGSLLEAMQNRHNQEITELKREMEARLNLQSQDIASIKSQLSTLKQKIASKLEVSRLSEMISDLKNKTGKLQADISQLVSDHDQLTTF